jgi:hypothetical protein
MTDGVRGPVNVAGWRGKLLVDHSGEKIAKLPDVYVDLQTDEPQFAIVQERHHRGAHGVRAAGRGSGRSGGLQVAVTAERVGICARPRDARRGVV